MLSWIPAGWYEVRFLSLKWGNDSVHVIHPDNVHLCTAGETRRGREWHQCERPHVREYEWNQRTPGEQKVLFISAPWWCFSFIFLTSLRYTQDEKEKKKQHSFYVDREAFRNAWEQKRLSLKFRLCSSKYHTKIQHVLLMHCKVKLISQTPREHHENVLPGCVKSLCLFFPMKQFLLLSVCKCVQMMQLEVWRKHSQCCMMSVSPALKPPSTHWQTLLCHYKSPNWIKQLFHITRKCCDPWDHKSIQERQTGKKMFSFVEIT